MSPLNQVSPQRIFGHLPATCVTIATLSIWCVCLTMGCMKKGPAPSRAGIRGKPLSNQIVAVSYPLQYLTQRIAGDSIDVTLPFPDGTIDPQNWRPSREAIGQMQAADLIIANGTGATYANWLTTVSVPDSKIRNTASRGLSLSDYIAVEDVTVVHSHGPEGEHSHPTMVARTWLDPAIAKKQAVYIAAELQAVYPDRAEEFVRHLKMLSDDLDQLSDQIKSIKRTDAHAIMTATPKLKFFARSVNLGDKHLTWFEPPNAERARSDLKKILEIAQPRPALLLFDGTLPTSELEEILEENGLTPIAIDLIDRKAESGDFLTQMRANIEALATAMEN